MAPASIAALASLTAKRMKRRSGARPTPRLADLFLCGHGIGPRPWYRPPSQVVERCVGTPGVAEPAALRAAQAERLLIEKQVITSTRSPKRMTLPWPGPPSIKSILALWARSPSLALAQVTRSS